MKHIILFIFLCYTIGLNASTNIVSWNPPAGGLKNTYSDSKNFCANAGDVISCRCYGTISSGSSVDIYLSQDGKRKNIYTHTNPNIPFDDVVTCQIELDGEYTLDYVYHHDGGGTAYSINIIAKLNDIVYSESLSLDTCSITLTVGDTYTLLPTIIPTYATNKKLSWNSSCESVAAVSQDGVITANKAGAAVITAITTDGTNLKSYCKVSVNDHSVHHDYVDLGLPSGTLWATTNVGAMYPEDPGYNYAWGELYPSENYRKSDASNYTLSKYNEKDGLTTLESEDDIACQMWGDDWHIPTKEDFQELIDNCTFSFDYTSAATSINGYVIVKFTAKNGKYLLLPQSTILASYAGTDITYWTSSLASSASSYIYYAQTSTRYNAINGSGRWKSMPIRPVSKVIKVKELSVTPTKLDLNVGDISQIQINIEPSNATVKDLLLTSSDDTIVEIDNTGNVKALKKGTAEIKVSTTDGTGLFVTCIINVHNPVTSISLNSTDISMHVGERVTITPECLPNDADDTSVTWSTSNSDIASIDDFGIVSAKAVGVATITATTVNGKNASCIINVVTTSATYLSLNKTSMELIVGTSDSLTATILPSNTTNKGVSWKSNNSNVANVTSNGQVTAISTGVAIINATTTDGTELSASCVVTVTNPVKSVNLNTTSAEITVGQQITLLASCIPNNADDTRITWVSSNEHVATVVEGVVTAKSIGSTTITASSVNGLVATCEVSVVPTQVTKIALNKNIVYLAKGTYVDLVCTILPEDATNKKVEWFSNNPEIASVANNGRVSAIATGTTTIVVISMANSNIMATCTINVTTPITSMELDRESCELYVDDLFQLNAIYTPSDADSTKIEWESTDSNIVEVSSEGLVRAKSAGSAQIIARTTDGTDISVSCKISVRKYNQTITWNQHFDDIQVSGEMIVLNAASSSGLPLNYKTGDSNIASIFNLGDVTYLNPTGIGCADIIVTQLGNYKYNSIEERRTIQIIGNETQATKTLIAYYSNSSLIDGIVAELACQLSDMPSSNVYTAKIEPINNQINDAYLNNEIQDSIMNIIYSAPNDLSSYPEIKPLGIKIDEYDAIIMVYPLWNNAMAAPMQTFNFIYKSMLDNKSIAYIEYDISSDGVTSSNTNVLRLNAINIENKEHLIKDWWSELEATKIKPVVHDKIRLPNCIYDMLGRRLTKIPKTGLFIINGKKTKIH